MLILCYRCSLIPLYPLFLEEIVYQCSIGFSCFSVNVAEAVVAEAYSWDLLLLVSCLISLAQCKCFRYITLLKATVSNKVSINNFSELSHGLLKYSFQLKGLRIEPRVRGTRLGQPAEFVYFYMSMKRPIWVCHTWVLQQKPIRGGPIAVFSVIIRLRKSCLFRVVHNCRAE